MRLSSGSISIEKPSYSSRCAPVTDLTDSSSLIRLCSRLISALLLLSAYEGNPMRPQKSPASNSLASLSVNLRSINAESCCIWSFLYLRMALFAAFILTCDFMQPCSLRSNLNSASGSSDEIPLRPTPAALLS